MFEMADEVECLIRHEIPLQRTFENEIEVIEARLSQASLQTTDLTPAESATLEAWKFLHSASLSVFASGPISSISSDLAALAKWLEARRESLFSADEPTFGLVFGASSAQPHALLPWSSALQCLFLHLEVLRAAHRFCDAASAATKQKGHKVFGKVPKDGITKTQAAVQASFDKIREVAITRRNAIDEEGTAGLVEQMRDGKTGEALVDVMGGVANSFLRETAALYVDAAKDTLDGVLKVKLKTVA